MQNVWNCCLMANSTIALQGTSSVISKHPMNKNSKLRALIKPNNLIRNRVTQLDKLVSEDSLKVSIIMENDVIYQGEIKNRKPNDEKAIVIFSDGSYYQGNVINGIIQGFGCYNFSDQSYSYSGQWRKGLPNGYGVEVAPTGKYQGSFKHGKKWGKGQLTYLDGSIFNGSFIDNQISGDGVLYSEKYMAKGNWINGFLEGAGVQRYNDNSEYMGPFKKGKPHGLGTFTLSDGKVYVGNFQNGKAVGVGQFFYKNKEYSKELKDADIISISVSAQRSNTLSNSQAQYNKIYNELVPNLSNRSSRQQNYIRKNSDRY